MRSVTIGLLICVAAPAQSDEVPRWRIDPYTRNQPEAMKRAGYVSFGPFEFGQRGSRPTTTEELDEALEHSQVLWAETAHFRLGLALDAWQVPTDLEARRKIREELEALAERLPRISPRTRRLDPWLRLHLIAMRCEQQYAEFQDWLGVTDADFPAVREDVQVVSETRDYMGEGPYLGMRSKFLLLLVQDNRDYRTYMQTFVGKPGDHGQRAHFTDIGALLYSTAIEGGEDDLRDDTVLHCNLAFNNTYQFIDGFRHYSYDLPVWITEGLAHWFERRVDPRYNTFTLNESATANERPAWRWELETRRLIGAGRGAPFSEVYTWRDTNQILFSDHVLVWSRWDWLMSQGKARFSDFMFHLKGRVDPKTWTVDDGDIVEATRDALRRVYGVTPLSLDEKWTEWVLATYPAK